MVNKSIKFCFNCLKAICPYVHLNFIIKQTFDIINKRISIRSLIRILILQKIYIQ